MKRVSLRTVVLWTGVLCCCCVMSVVQRVSAAPEDKTAPAEKERVPADTVTLKLKEKRVEIAGRFCLKEGILDYLAVGAAGQEYESVVALDGKGSTLHAGLLALGAVPGPTKEVLEALRKNPREGVKLPDRVGSALNITLEWTRDGKTVSMPAARTMFNRKTGKAQQSGRWIFTGSHFAKDFDGKEFYMADVDRSLIAVVYMTSAVINFDEEAGNPYAGPDEGYEVNKGLVPPPDTPVKMVITLAKPLRKD